ncbi:hypothetical protein ACFS7Z_25710 [Pontibacter toksunensis]|uniref:Uncharacterized protein n=1 Tax=Pontibacter toksunensis TaxID=1332631 RepID=A0ABW6C125_9BACT
MKDRHVEKLLYKIAAVLVVCGAVVRILGLSDNYLGLHLILSGLITGVIAIFLYIKYENEQEQNRAAMKDEQQLKKQ